MQNVIATDYESPADPVGMFLSDPESHLSDILYINFRHYKKRVIYEMMRKAIDALDSAKKAIVFADIGASMAFDLMYFVRRMEMVGDTEKLARMDFNFLEGDPALRRAGESLWSNCPTKVKFEFKEAFLTEELPMVPGSVQIALCSEVVEHMEDPGELLRRIHTILQPGGYLILTTDNCPSLLQLVRRLPRRFSRGYKTRYTPARKEAEVVGSYVRNGKTYYIYGHISLKPTWEWEKICKQCGFVVEEYGTYESLRRGGAGHSPFVLAAHFVGGFLVSCLPRRIGRYFGDTTALLLRKI